MPRIIIIGGGLIGLATAYRLQQRSPRIEVFVLEKENAVGMHQSGRNSGVLHAGLHYAPGSLKARLAVRGIREMIAFCRAHDISHEVCGKLVLCARLEDIPRLDELQRRSVANGLHGVRRLDVSQTREIEPYTKSVAALHVPEEGIVDYPAVAQVLARLICASGGRVELCARVHTLTRERRTWRVGHARGELTSDYIVNCAGLQSDRVALLAGRRIDMRIVPFRGEYFVLKPERRYLVRHLIYPVPDPSLPFLGVHLTRRIDGQVECGPNAVLTLHREGYYGRRIRSRDAVESLLFPGLWRFILRNPRACAYELARSLSRREFARSFQQLIPSLEFSDLLPGPAGIRAQAVRQDGSLVEDFEFAHGPGELHVLNAPSPAATACLALGNEIAGRVLALGFPDLPL